MCKICDLQLTTVVFIVENKMVLFLNKTWKWTLLVFGGAGGCVMNAAPLRKFPTMY